MHAGKESSQASLFGFDENILMKVKETMRTTEYEFVEPLRKCKRCNILKPLSAFRDISKQGMKKHQRTCKDCAEQQAARRRKENPEILKNYFAREDVIVYRKEQRFLYFKSNGRCSGYFCGTGVCILCGELHPFVFENRHLYPNCDFILSLCGSCHRKYRTGHNQDLHMQVILRAIESTPFLWKGVEIARDRKETEHRNVTHLKTTYIFGDRNMEVVSKCRN